MFEIDLDVNEGEWFTYQDSRLDHDTGECIFDDPVPGVRVRIRQMQSFVREKAITRKKAAEHVLNPKTRAMERITYYKELTPEEQKKESDDIWDHIITGLEGFKNKKTGEVIECSRENKLKLMLNTAFDRFVGRCLRILDGSEERRKEESEKN